MGKPRSKPNNNDSKKKIPKRKDGEQIEQPPKKPKSALQLFKARLMKNKAIEAVPMFSKKRYAHMIADTEKPKIIPVPKARATFEEMISGKVPTGTEIKKPKEEKKKKVVKNESL